MAPRTAPEISALYSPHDVIAVEVIGGADPDTLHPQERILVEHASEHRQREFAAGRLAARLAVEALGATPVPIGRTTRRAPRWPPHVTGSIAHTADVAIAVCSAAPVGIGVDLERIGRLNTRVARRVCTTEELERLETLDSTARDLAATQIFGAKEAFYKAQYQLTDAFLGFDDMTTVPRADELLLHRASDHEATANLQLPATARFLRRGDLMITASSVASSATTSS